MRRFITGDRELTFRRRLSVLLALTHPLTETRYASKSRMSSVV